MQTTVNKMNKEEILKKHYWNNCQVDVNKEVIESESPFIYKAMQEYVDHQSSEKDKEIESLKQKLQDAVVAINSMIYESNGALFVGINGDSQVPNKVYEFLTKLKQ